MSFDQFSHFFGQKIISQNIYLKEASYRDKFSIAYKKSFKEE